MNGSVPELEFSNAIFAKRERYTSDLAAKAAKNAIEDAKLKPDDIDLLIVATITPDMPFPSTACLVQTKLGLGQIAAFDVEAACSGFLYALIWHPPCSKQDATKMPL